MSSVKAKRYFSYEGLTICVQADAVSHLDWLEEFLCPAYSTRETGITPEIEIQLETDEACFNALYEKGPGEPADEHPIFVLDTRVVELPAWHGRDKQLTLYQESTSTFFEISQDRRRVRLISRAVPRCRIPLMRVLREFTMNHCMQQGGVFLHASAVAYGDAGLLIVGSKRAGKTSLMTHFLRNTSAAYIANDRVYINPREVPLSMRGMPTIASIRAAMPALFPGMQEQLDNSFYHHHRTIDECRGRAHATQSKQGIRYSLSPAQMLDLHAADARPSVRPQALLFPRVSASERGVRILPLSSAEISRRIPTALYGISTLGKHPVVLSTGAEFAASVKELLMRCERVAASLPCFEVLLGQEAYQDPATTEAIVSSVLS
ncbi:MAG: hypothetical protein AAGI11_11080 [Pseudomonadota bacterium]